VSNAYDSSVSKKSGRAATLFYSGYKRLGLPYAFDQRTCSGTETMLIERFAVAFVGINTKERLRASLADTTLSEFYSKMFDCIRKNCRLEKIQTVAYLG